MILAGDIGGTKSNLGLFDIPKSGAQQGSLVRVADKRYTSREHKGLEEIVKDFVSFTGAKVTAASFGIAGPVVNDRVQTGNLPWIVDGGTMASQLGLDRVRLMNDLEATAFGINVMQPADLDVIYEGIPAPETHRAVIAAGTGLGEAVLFWDGAKHMPMATEGGHADFAPHTNQQADLWKFMKSRGEFASAELVLSGRGFMTLHEFLDASVQHPSFDDPAADPAREITGLALAGTCPVCVNTLDLWVEIYGSEAGNLAVRSVARGGIYVAGGIALKILPKLKDGRFAAAVRDKEKMAYFLEQVPLHVVLDEECPLKGAAYAVSKGL
jgi:glucokinase